jgi:hypothetical protein
LLSSKILNEKGPFHNSIGEVSICVDSIKLQQSKFLCPKYGMSKQSRKKRKEKQESTNKSIFVIQSNKELKKFKGQSITWKLL